MISAFPRSRVPAFPVFVFALILASGCSPVDTTSGSSRDTEGGVTSISAPKPQAVIDGEGYLRELAALIPTATGFYINSEGHVVVSVLPTTACRFLDCILAQTSCRMARTEGGVFSNTNQIRNEIGTFRFW